MARASKASARRFRNQAQDTPKTSAPRSRNQAQDRDADGLEKARTGIRGFDEITLGGLPRGRTTLVCGGPGCGKTVFATEFLVRGARQYGEPGVFVSFEETADDLRKNVTSLGFDLSELMEQKLLAVDHVRVERSEIEETGEYSLEGLFIRLGYAIDSLGARRVVLDTIESLFSGFSNYAILRAELRRLFSWLKEKEVTAIITGERGDGTLTRQGLEEYVSDCVILLDHRVQDEHTTRRLRIVKYRGSTHGTNEYPFLIEESGVSVIPITSLGLRHEASDERLSTGVPALDAMLDGRGYYRGSSVLITGTAGSGKTSLAAHFAASLCGQGERCVYFAFEESESQIVRNMRSIGLDLKPLVDKGLLVFQNVRPSAYGLEMHLAMIHKAVNDLSPSGVVVDPVSNITQAGRTQDVGPTLVRLIDFFKSTNITGLFTSLTSGADSPEATNVGVSSLMDTWLLVRNLESGGERNRGLYVMKSRGMAHSNQIREFLLTSDGIELVDVYTGPHGVLTGSARAIQAANESAEEALRQTQMSERERRFERKRAALQAQMASLELELDAERAELELVQQAEAARRDTAESLRTRLAETRGKTANGGASRTPGKPRKPSTSGAQRREGRRKVRS